MPLTGNITLSVSAKQTATLDLGAAVADLLLSQAVVFANGTGAAQADKAWSDRRQLAASGSEDLDLNGGSALLDPYGAAVSFVKIRWLGIKALASNTNNLVVGAAAANAWANLLNSTGTLTLRPGEAIFVACGAADATGHTVTPGTGDQLKIANAGGGTAVDYDILVIGTSA